MRHYWFSVLLTIIVAFSGHLHAQVTTSQIHMLVDNDNAFYYKAPYIGFTVDVFIDPSDYGLNSVDYAIEYPDWLIYTGSFAHPSAIITTNEEFYYNVTFTECQYDYIAFHQHSFITTLASQIGDITFRNHQELVVATNCLEGNPSEDIIVNWGITINYIQSSNEVSNWGVIKAIFKQ